MRKRTATVAFELVGWGLVYGIVSGSEFWSNVAAVYFWMLAVMGVVALIGSLSDKGAEMLMNGNTTASDHILWALSLGKFVVLTGLGWAAGATCLIAALLLKLRWWAAVNEGSA